jgi:RHS repeat-associated protein
VSYNTLSQVLQNAGTTTAHCLTGFNQNGPTYTEIAGIATVDALFPSGAENGSTLCHNPYVVSTVEMPNSTNYSLLYNQYGEIAEVDLPTGGSFQYDTQSGVTGDIAGATSATSPSNGGGLGAPPYTLYRRVTNRRVYKAAGVLESQTSFPVISNTSLNSTTDEAVSTSGSNGALESIKHTYFGNPFSDSVLSPWLFYPYWTQGRECQTVSQNPSTSAAIRTVAHTWQNGGTTSPTICSTQPPAYTGSAGQIASDPQIVETDTTLNDASSAQVASTVYTYDQYNNVTTAKDYDYGTTALGGTLLREVDTTFYTGSYIAAVSGVYLPSLKQTESITQTVTTTVNNQPVNTTTTYAKTTFSYDAYSGTNLCALTNRQDSLGNQVGFGTSTILRGNLTTADQWLNTAGASDVFTYSCYDTAGNVTQKTDGRTIATTLKYDQDSSGSEKYPFAHLTGLTRDGFTVNMTWDPDSDRILSITDPNSNKTTYNYLNASGAVDGLDRLTGVSYPDLGSTSYVYTDTYPNQVQTTSLITGSGDSNCTVSLSKSSTVTYDGLGRVTRSHQTDPQGDTYVDTVYDGMGRIYQVSNPYRQNGPVNNLTRTYDAIGRPSSTSTPDAAKTTFTYVGNVASIQNPRMNIESQTADALGRLTQVTEEDGTVAYYTYDPLGDLLSVIHDDPNAANCGLSNQNPRARCFNYDSLKRLTSVLNPENGTIAYTYDQNGNLLTKTTQRGVKTTINYDNLDRPVSKTYSGTKTAGTVAASATPNIAYSYDTAANGKTRLASVTATLNSQSYVTNYNSYDAMGRVTASSQVMPGTPANLTYSFTYAYNLAGELELETYPTLRQVKTCYDSVGRISTVSNPAATTPYATVDSTTGYEPFGAIKKLTFGNNVVENMLYDAAANSTTESNTRMQLTQKSVTLGSSNSLLALTYGYCPTALTGCTTNNGDVLSQTISPNGATGPIFSQTYGYDALDRLTSAVEANASPGTGWTETYGFKWSNKYTSSRTGSLPALTGQTPQTASSFSTSNQVTSSPPGNTWSYDDDGNLTVFASGPLMSYDGENHMVSSTPSSGSASTYIYDGLGDRVQAATPGPVTTTFVYDAMGGLVAEYASGTSVASSTMYLTDDALGSTRLMTDSSGVVQARYDYLPFGEEIWSAANGRSSITGYVPANTLRLKFTGKERDAETGLDYFGARYLSAAQGRFTSPDPLLNSGRPDNPQSWNRYAYVSNNPLIYKDPFGLYQWAVSCDEKSSSSCRESRQRFRDALKRLEQARDKYKKGSEAYNSLNAAREAFGSEYDPKTQNILISFDAKPGSPGGASTPDKDGNIVVRIDDRTMAMRNTVDFGIQYAATLGHEGTHVADYNAGFRPPQAYEGYFNLEFRAYGAESLVDRAFHADSILGIWNEAWTDIDKHRAEYQQALKNAATNSAGFDCRQDRGCKSPK